MAALTALLCVLFLSFYATVPIPQNSDLYLALPIAKESASPGLYAPQDLIVSSGARGPFYLYRAVGGALYSAGADVELVWHALFLGCLWLTFAALWWLAYQAGQSIPAATLATGLLAVMHPLRGSLHWSWVPLPAFVTAAAAMPFGLGALALALRRRWLWALLLAGATFNLHPYVGLIALAACSAGVVFAAGAAPWRQRGVWLGAGAAAALPNAFAILATLPANFAADAGAFYEMFRVYAYHAFVEDHWREGYGWFALNAAGALFFARYLPRQVRRPLAAMSGALLALMGLYLLNLYFVRIPALLLAFLFRATYFLKPLLIAAIVAGAARWLRARDWPAQLPSARVLRGWEPTAPPEAYLALGLLALSALIPPVPAAEALALLAYALLLLVLRRARPLAAPALLLGCAQLLLAVAPRSLPTLAPPDWWWDVAVGINVAASVAIALAFHGAPAAADTVSARPDAPRAGFALLGGLFVAGVLVNYLWFRAPEMLRPRAAADLLGAIRLSAPDPATAGLVAWARGSTAPGALFVLPPADPRFAAFRLAAERGVFIRIDDVNQLAFDAQAYAAAGERLALLGVRALGRHTFDVDGYRALSADTLRRLRAGYAADYIVFDAGGPVAAGFPEAYRDNYYVVYDLRGGA